MSVIDSTVEARLRSAIRDVPDFPKEGILFRDITTLLKDAEAFSLAIGALCEPFEDDPPDLILGIESRGFIFGAAMADRLGRGLVISRKAGRLPAATEQVSFALEYGEDTLELHADAIQPGQRVLIVDDLIATGGTARGGVELVQKVGGRVEGLAFLIELCFLEGTKQLEGYPVHVVLRYE